MLFLGALEGEAGLSKAVKECDCPEIVDTEWDLTEHTWDDKSFFTVSLPMVMHRPIGLKTRMDKAMTRIREKGYKMIHPRTVLQKDGFLRGKIMIGIKKPAEAGPNVDVFHQARLVSKVFVGPWSGLGRGVSELLSFIRSKERAHPKAIYFWYVTCRQCVETENDMKTVILAEL